MCLEVKCENEPRVSERVIVKHLRKHPQVHHRSARSAFLPDSCKCDVTTIKIPVCEQELSKNTPVKILAHID